MRAGALRDRIDLQRPAPSISDWGEPVDGWESAATLWASVRLQQSSEQEASTGATTVTKYDIRIRYRSEGISTRYRIVWRGKVLQILAMGDPDGKRRELLLTAVEYPEAANE